MVKLGVATTRGYVSIHTAISLGLLSPNLIAFFFWNPNFVRKKKKNAGRNNFSDLIVFQTAVYTAERFVIQ